MTAALAHHFEEYHGMPTTAFGVALTAAPDLNDWTLLQDVIDQAANSDSDQDGQVGHHTLEWIHPEDLRAKMAAFLSPETHPETARLLGFELLSHMDVGELDPVSLNVIQNRVLDLAQDAPAHEASCLKALAGIEDEAPALRLGTPAFTYNMGFAA